jgi:hypothetical protein
MSAIRVSGRKNSGINIAGFNSQDGENAYYCNCYNCYVPTSVAKGIGGAKCKECKTRKQQKKLDLRSQKSFFESSKSYPPLQPRDNPACVWSEWESRGPPAR